MLWNALPRKVVKPSSLNLLNRFVEVVLQELVMSGRWLDLTILKVFAIVNNYITGKCFSV